MSKEADLIIIGAGPGGYRAAEYAEKILCLKKQI